MSHLENKNSWHLRHLENKKGCHSNHLPNTYIMTDTPPGCHSSWVDLTKDFPSNSASPPVPSSPNRSTPVPLVLDQGDYIKMLREAQREYSAKSSARASPISSALVSVSSTGCKNTPSTSPKSPPNSPNVELVNYCEQLKEDLKQQGVFINREPEPSMDDIIRDCGGVQGVDWRSRPNMFPPRAWQQQHRSPASPKQVEGDGKEGRRLLLALLASNLVSLALGVGLGYWLYRRSASSDVVGVVVSVSNT